MVPVSERASGRSVVTAPECSARREARLAGAGVPVRRGDRPRGRSGRLRRRRGRRARGGRRGGRGGRRRASAVLVSAMVRRFGLPAADGLRLRGRAAAGPRRCTSNDVMRAAGGRCRVPVGGLRRVPCGFPVGVRPAGGGRRHDHLRRWGWRAGMRARAAGAWDVQGPRVREQDRRGYAQRERYQERRQPASNYPDAPCAAFIGRQRPVSPFPADLPDPRPHHEYKKPRRTATGNRRRLPLFPGYSSAAPTNCSRARRSAAATPPHVRGCRAPREPWQRGGRPTVRGR